MAVFAQLSVEVTGENIACFGLSSGTATAEVDNGTAPYTYAWSNGGSTATIRNLNAGTYNVTVTDAGGMTGTGSITLTQPTRVTATISVPNQCEGPFMIAAEPEGGVVPYRYNWSTGADTRAVLVPAGAYCVTVVDANQCGFVACTTLEEDPPTVTLVGVNATCFDADNGSITATPVGGTAPYTYAWSNGRTGQTITGLAPGGYQVTLTDARGCTATASTSISEPPAITGNIFGDNSVCPGVADAFLRINPMGGTPPYSYVWSPGGFTGQGVGPLPAGTYSVVVTDANGCTRTSTFLVTESPEVAVAITGDELLCGLNTRGTLSAAPVSGPVNQYTYQWSTGATTPTITNVGAGTYTVTATDVNGCTGTATATVEVVDVSVSLSSTPVSCFGGNDGTATATASGGTEPYTYVWSNGATTATITGLTVGTYSVTVTEADGCKASGSVQVTAPSRLIISATPTNVVCAGENNGSIDVSVSGGTPAYTYLWSNGATTQDLSNLTAGTYGVTVTDANGCTANTSVVVTQPTPLAITPQITNVACAGDATGAISLTVTGGTPAYTYAWTNGATTRNIQGLVAGSYTVTVTDARGCQLVATYTVTQPPALSLVGLADSTRCFGDNTGSIDITAAGGTAPLSFAWSNGATTEDLMNLAAGTYTVTVTDANECEATRSFVVRSPNALALTATPDNVNCAGGSDGGINLSVTGGTAPYTYLWSNGATGEDLTGLTTGVYTVAVTDANGCRASLSVSVQEPTPLAATGQVTSVACPGDATGSIDLTVTGGTSPYTYLWSTGATTQDVTGLTDGTYTVTITDANACLLTQSFTVTSNPGIAITGTVSPVRCAGGNTGAIDVTVAGGSGTYAYVWSTGATTQDLTGLAAGNYTLTVSDGNACDAVASFTVTEPTDIGVSVTAPTITCGGTPTGTITVLVTGGTPPYTYLWSNGATTAMVSGLAAGSYSVTVTDANGCQDVTSGITLTELPALECAVTILQEATEGNNGSLRVDPSGGTIPYTYAWSNGATTQTISGLAAGVYTATVTDANGCTTTCSATLRALSGLGDFVWEDFNVNGQQDPNEPGIFDYPVYLKNAAGIIIDSTRTDSSGFYAFMGLNPGTYSVLFPEPPGGIRTLANTGNDATDSDGDPAMGGMTQNYTLAPGEFNMTVDAGFFAEPGGVIADPCNCLNNNTNDIDGQFSEAIEVTANVGQTWTIIERANMFTLDSPEPPLAPIPVPIGTTLDFLRFVEGDSTKAVYGISFRLVDSFNYFSVITNGVYELTIANQCFYPIVRYVEAPPEELCRFDEPVVLDGFGLLNGQPLPGTVVFTVNGMEVTEINPADLPLGTNILTAEFTPDDPEECIPILETQIVIFDDCNAKLGDFVWQDNNTNGVQDPGEPGISGVKVTVTSQDGTYMDMTTTDGAGMYMFSVPPGTYKITFEQPADFSPTTPNAGNDALDSDMNPTTLMTPFYTVGPDEMNFTIDAGFVSPCIQNVSNPGTIAASQELCGPGNVPQPLVEIVPASGGIGEIEYLWMFNTVSAGQDIAYWQTVPNSNTPNYAPGPIYQTTYFVRCVRRNNCPFIEGNVLTIEVGDDAVAQVSGPSSVCVGESATFQASNPGAGAQISWTFTGNSSVQTSNSPIVTTTWSTFGSFSATLSVTANGCTSTQVFHVSVLNNPTRCGGNLTASGSVNNLQAREVSVEWMVPADGTDYTFALERSTDGQTFRAIADVTAPAFVTSGDMAMFRYDDVSPLAGRTFYRVRMLDDVHGDMLSNVVELQLGGATTALGRVFPNPATNNNLHVEMSAEATAELAPSVQLYDVRGNAVGPRQFLAPGTGVINLNTSAQAAGVYFLRLTVGDRTETHRVILE
ncbi:SdrD B-like domain-containing protein [Neolewinella lacunae]|uniref:T9SS type A sorting domain-containing protein n=1 Tax=Neolewinella lacunae TaxID=1517758 RepID=A0A923PIB4_9BACT|nr:SdrD B-like domain-containing protein [Neolewinella lacunae]MBC6993809.1 T9SS type A sorting domain-containing protein [Neolewinella lacunae]MDN3635300.1 SdrD B-like domain-containing protein [Neolewinella lacunae]